MTARPCLDDEQLAFGQQLASSVDVLVLMGEDMDEDMRQATEPGAKLDARDGQQLAGFGPSLRVPPVTASS